MASITIRNVPDSARDQLAARAARSGRSLQEYLRQHLIDVAGRPDPLDLAARVSDRKRRLGTTLSAESIVGHRDDGRR